MTAHNAIVHSIPVNQIIATSNIRLSNGHDKESLTQLAESIRAHGLLQPIVVRNSQDDEPAPYVIVAGRRRLAACKLAKLDTIPALISDTDESKAYELEIAENIQREQMTLADTARAVRTLMLIHDSAKKVGQIVNKSPAWVSKHLTVTASAFSPVAAQMLDSGVVQDLETLMLVNQVHKHMNGSAAITRLVNLAANGQLSRQIAQDTLARLKAPAPTAPAPVTTTTTHTHAHHATHVTNAAADPRLTFTVELPVRLLADFERLGGVEWVAKLIEAAE